MNFNTFLLRLGLDPDNFKNIPSDPIKTDKVSSTKLNREQIKENAHTVTLTRSILMIMLLLRSAVQKIMKFKTQYASRKYATNAVAVIKLSRLRLKV